MARMKSDKVFRAWEVRNLLYDELNREQHCKNDHLFAYQQENVEHPADCRACEMYDRIMQGMRACIRLFGGRPRYS